MNGQLGIAYRLVQQVLVIFLLTGVGIFLKKKKLVDLSAARMFSNVVLVVVIPALLLHTFLSQEGSDGMGLRVLFGLALAIAFHLLSILVTRFVYPKLNDQTAVERLAVNCSNCGFMGIPLILATVGNEGTIYAALYICIFNIYNWTHAAMILRRVRTISLKKALCTPGVLSAIAGLLIFFWGLRFPYPIEQTLSMISGMNTPLPTILMGVFIADLPWGKVLATPRVYLTSLLRLLGMPLLFLALLWVLRVDRWFPGSGMVAFVLMICCSCSSGISTVLLPARFGGGDEGYGGSLIAVSTLLSVVTIPLVVTVAGQLLAV